MSSSHDPGMYLETEARIIAENETHAVVAVRVDKKWIARNLGVFAALSNLPATTKPAKAQAV